MRRRRDLQYQKTMEMTCHLSQLKNIKKNEGTEQGKRERECLFKKKKDDMISPPSFHILFFHSKTISAQQHGFFSFFRLLKALLIYYIIISFKKITFVPVKGRELFEKCNLYISHVKNVDRL